MTDLEERPPIVIAGGGTMGHVTPGLAIAAELESRGWSRDELHLVGSRRGVEVDVVPRAGYRLHVLHGRGIQRRPTVDNVGAAVGLVRGVGQAVGLLRRLRPAVVVATGGYASVGCALGAATLRIPIVVAEQNAVPGLANRLTSRVAAASAVSFADTGLRNEVVTGNPVRAEVLAVARRDRSAVRSELGVDPSTSLLLVFGGSLGARRINHAVLDAVEQGRTAGWSVRHVIGRRDWDSLAERIGRVSGAGYEAVEYEDRLPAWMRAADLVLCRSGASTVAELGVLGVPAVLVPLPGAPGDHQTANARALVDAGAAVLARDDELTAERIGELVGESLADDAALVSMGEAARTIGRPDAADRVADLVEEHLRVR